MELEGYQDYQDDEYSDYPDDGYNVSEQLKELDVPTGQNTQDILFQKSNTYYIMDHQKTQKYIDDMVNDIRDDWGVSESFALRLLQKFGWEKERALNNLTGEGNFDSLEVEDQYKNGQFDCPICYSTESVKDGYSFGCSHLYCKDCFYTYLKTSIDDAQPFQSCPTEGCHEVLAPKLCEKYLKNDPELLLKYRRYLFKTIVDTSKNLLWCPGQKCVNIIQLLRVKKGDESLLNIRCQCGHCFCFSCRDVAHRPLHCDKFSKWMGLVGGKDDSLNSGWIKKNSKKCPKCKVNIEKNQGCMHMTCRNCNYQFCWLCSQDWQTHGSSTGGFYNCNKYQQSNTIDDEQKEYEKFNFYRDRFEQHWNSIGFASKKKKTILENFKMINYQVQTPKDENFLNEALDLIIEARRAITMTYATGYFIRFHQVDKEIFEMQQTLLWEALDNLDKYTDQLQDRERMQDLLVNIIQETCFLAGKFNDFKIQLTARTSGVVAACNKLLKYIEEDLQQNSAPIAKPQIEAVDEFGFEVDNNDFANDHWYCAFCTFSNPNSNTRCEACESIKTVHKGNIF